MFCCKKRLMVCFVIGAQTKFHWLLGTTETARGRRGNHDVWDMALDDFLSLLSSCLSQVKTLAFPVRVKIKPLAFPVTVKIKPWHPLSETKEEGQCSCALFANQNITGIESLLSKEIPLNITCGTEGQAICNSTCVSLVQAVKDKGPIILCGTLKGHNVGLKRCDKNTKYPLPFYCTTAPKYLRSIKEQGCSVTALSVTETRGKVNLDLFQRCLLQRGEEQVYSRPVTARILTVDL
uniref:Uncharacterized protein n=1 Tax=Timema tahoe TaxID=61484 RepID=A0A7R9IS50_9NEOP|nr:unnamed protein product [Timema tahoe]